MQADFLDAHERHWDDAERLLKAGRWANADHLHGLAAECGLKRLMLAFGMHVDPNTGNPRDGQDRKHVDGIWTRFESYRSGRVQGASYALSNINPFLNWSVSDRYAHQSNFDQERAHKHKVASQVIHQFIVKAKLEGLL